MAEKTYVFDSSNGGQSAIDPNLWAALNNGGGFGGGQWMNNPIWAIVFLAFLGRGFGFGGDGNCSNAFVSSQLGQAIAGNANAISNLATSLNCTEGQIQSAISNVQNSVQQLANANNMSAMQIINAINSGDATLANSLQSCCCNITNAVNTGFGNLRYEEAANTCSIKQNATDNTGRILAKLDAIEDSRKDREISTLTAQLTAANSRAERAAELAPIYKALSDVQCKLPNTVTVPQNNGVLVPSCVAYQMGLYGGFPYNQNGSIWP